MRRKEFLVEDRDKILDILNECEYGVLSLIYKNSPYSVALNFVYLEDCIYFHGANKGQKIDAIKQNPNASFLAVLPYSLIPSYFSDQKSACPATQYFASVHVNGNIKEIRDSKTKAKILNALMQKLQKDGGYEKIDEENAIYKNSLKFTSVLALNIKSLTCKLKIGQNLSKDKFNNIAEKLKTRGEPKDIKTASLMENLI